MIRDFHVDEICHGDYRLQVRDYNRTHTVFELSLLGLSETIVLDHMIAQYHPELFDLYDFEQKRWVQSEVADFLEGLHLCLH